MKKLLIAAICTISVISVGFVYAEPPVSMEEKIRQLEKTIEQKDLIIQEQMNTIMKLHGLIPVQYEPFNQDKFYETGGYDPKWLEDKREILAQNCIESRSDGFKGLGFCDLVLP